MCLALPVPEWGRGVPAGARSTSGTCHHPSSTHVSPAGTGTGRLGLGWQLGTRAEARGHRTGQHLPAQAEAMARHRCQRGGGTRHIPAAGSTLGELGLLSLGRRRLWGHLRAAAST